MVSSLAVVGRLADDFDPFLDVPRDEFVDRVAADPQVLFDPLQDVVAAGEDWVEPEARQGGKFVKGLEVKRIVGGDADFSVVASEGENCMPEHGRRGELAQQLPVDLDTRQVDEFEAQRVGERLKGVFLVDEPLFRPGRSRSAGPRTGPPPSRVAPGVTRPR